MTRPLPVQVIPRVAASAAVVFGVVTVMAGGRVLLGGDPGYLVFRPLLLFNTVMGAVYLIAGALVWRGAPGGRRLAGAIALVLTDGRPNDVDQYEGRYGVEDTRRAVREAAAEGILVFGPGRAALLRRPERLPAALVEVLRRLLELS
jgi:hypothetical protein